MCSECQLNSKPVKLICLELKNNLELSTVGHGKSNLGMAPDDEIRIRPEAEDRANHPGPAYIYVCMFCLGAANRTDRAADPGSCSRPGVHCDNARQARPITHGSTRRELGIVLPARSESGTWRTTVGRCRALKVGPPGRAAAGPGAGNMKSGGPRTRSAPVLGARAPGQGSDGGGQQKYY